MELGLIEVGKRMLDIATCMPSVILLLLSLVVGIVLIAEILTLAQNDTVMLRDLESSVNG